MSPQALRTLVALLLLAHGLGHALTALPLFGVRLRASHSAESWLLSGVVAVGVQSSICVTLNLVALLTGGRRGGRRLEVPAL